MDARFHLKQVTKKAAGASTPRRFLSVTARQFIFCRAWAQLLVPPPLALLPRELALPPQELALLPRELVQPLASSPSCQAAGGPSGPAGPQPPWSNRG